MPWNVNWLRYVVIQGFDGVNLGSMCLHVWSSHVEEHITKQPDTKPKAGERRKCHSTDTYVTKSAQE